MLLFILSIFKSIMLTFNRYRLIIDKTTKEPYLERYYLFLKERQSFPFNIFLHKFLKSDPDDLHDHPWNFISIPLYPGYWEITKEGKLWRYPFSIRYGHSTFLHRVELHKEYNYCWTLFIPGAKQRQWGFHTKEGWVHSDIYNST